MEQKLVSIGKEYEVKPDFDDLTENRELFHIHIKAQVARRVWGNDGFYPIYNQTNEVLQGALQLFEKSEELNRSEF